MNKTAFVSLLRHLLFLFIVLKFSNSITLIVQSEQCKTKYDHRLFFPHLLDKTVEDAYDFAIDLLFGTYTGLGVLLFVISSVCFVGAVCLNDHELINFAGGLGILFFGFAEVVAIFVISELISTLDHTITDLISELFDSVNYMPDYTGGFILQHVTDDLENFVYQNGWITFVTQASEVNKSAIDFLQIVMECCGAKGRFHWKIPPPTSCCSEKYRDENCTLDLGHSRSCYSYYGPFRNCLTSLLIQSVFSSLISFATGIVALYLAYIKVKYPKGDYETKDDLEDDHKVIFF